jgi:hypothetical protein
MARRAARLRCAAAACVTLLGAAACLAGGLTETETRWLRGAWPVISHARAEQLPLDVVVQPQPTPDAVPLALGFVDGRCKLVLSLRENPAAARALVGLEPDLVDSALELMAAHELAHCRRHLDGAWARLPAGFSPPAMPAGLDSGVHGDYAALQATRREEAFADLVGLAWTQQRHPQRYARLHSWLTGLRSADRVPGSHHDTLAWVMLARDGAALSGPSIFASATALWRAGLAAEPWTPKRGPRTSAPRRPPTAISTWARRRRTCRRHGPRPRGTTPAQRQRRAGLGAQARGIGA